MLEKKYLYKIENLDRLHGQNKQMENNNLKNLEFRKENPAYILFIHNADLLRLTVFAFYLALNIQIESYISLPYV